MLIKQTQVNILAETKDLIISNDINQPNVKRVLEVLPMDITTLLDDGFCTVTTLGALKATRVHMFDNETMQDAQKRKKLIKKITALSQEAIILLDTFSPKVVAHMVELIALERYQFNALKSDKKTKQKALYYHAEKVIQATEKGLIIAEAMNHTKELVNTPYSHLKASDLARYAKALERIEGIKVNVLEKEAIQAMNMGAFLAVNKGSIEPPLLIHMEYIGDKNSAEKTALIGKGVMFDTGGYSLKPSTSMVTMKMDMGGAATVLGAIEAIAHLKYPKNVMVIIAATDNRIGDHAIVPDDVIEAANGLTIEIISTDAEGRLTLADALWYAQKEGATQMIDVATLTGAIVAALGEEHIGAFTNQKAFLDKVLTIAEINLEKIWHMPISEGHHKAIKSFSADIKNSGGRLAGASTAAAFLERFVDEKTPWIHFDIAGATYQEKTGATGRLVKTLTELFNPDNT